jgi:hypothetical protein
MKVENQYKFPPIKVVIENEEELQDILVGLRYVISSRRDSVNCLAAKMHDTLLKKYWADCDSYNKKGNQ